MKFAFNMLIVSEEINFVPHSMRFCHWCFCCCLFSATREIQLRIRNIHVLLAERSLETSVPPKFSIFLMLMINCDQVTNAVIFKLY